MYLIVTSGLCTLSLLVLSPSYFFTFYVSFNFIFVLFFRLLSSDHGSNTYGEAKKAGASILRSNDKTAILFYGSSKEPIALATISNNFYWPVSSLSPRSRSRSRSPLVLAFHHLLVKKKGYQRRFS
jgi:hypothetical protein